MSVIMLISAASQKDTAIPPTLLYDQRVILLDIKLPAFPLQPIALYSISISKCYAEAKEISP